MSAMGKAATGLVTVTAIEDAARRLHGVVRPTPARPAHAVAAAVGRAVVLKPEHLQRTGSFKVRGAMNRLMRLREDHPDDDLVVVAASAGNHAQGVALAASHVHARAVVFMPTSVSYPKLEATRRYGAEVVLEGDSVDEAATAARAWAADADAVFVPPFDDVEVVAGQGTLGLELAVEAPDATTVLVPVGGGGLISGIAVALRDRRPRIRIVGVQTAACPSMLASLEAGHAVTVQGGPTLADGIAVRSPSALTLAHVEALVDDMVTVSEDDLARAVVLLLERARGVVEPSGAAGLAALLAGRVGGRDPVALVCSGGNVDAPVLAQVIDFGLDAAGRVLVLRLVLADRPGALAGAMSAIAELGLNVQTVEHHRFGAGLAVDEVEVVVTVETRDPAHRTEVVERLRGRGLRVELLT